MLAAHVVLPTPPLPLANVKTRGTACGSECMSPYSRICGAARCRHADSARLSDHTIGNPMSTVSGCTVFRANARAMTGGITSTRCRLTARHTGHSKVSTSRRTAAGTTASNSQEVPRHSAATGPQRSGYRSRVDSSWRQSEVSRPGVQLVRGSAKTRLPTAVRDAKAIALGDARYPPGLRSGRITSGELGSPKQVPLPLRTTAGTTALRSSCGSAVWELTPCRIELARSAATLRSPEGRPGRQGLFGRGALRDRDRDRDRDRCTRLGQLPWMPAHLGTLSIASIPAARPRMSR